MKILKYVGIFIGIFILFTLCAAYFTFNLSYLYPGNWDTATRVFSLFITSIGVLGIYMNERF